MFLYIDVDYFALYKPGLIDNLRAGDSQAMNNLGVLFAGRGDDGEAETWWRQALDAEVREDADDSGAFHNLLALFQKRSEYGGTER
ncbi:hypothetical protein [Geodermatophilus sp. URMC 63]